MQSPIFFVRSEIARLVFKATFTWNWIHSDPFGIGFTMVLIHPAYTGPVRIWNGTVPYGISFVSGSVWYQMTDPIRIGSTKSSVNTKLICTNSAPLSIDLVPCRHCLCLIEPQSSLGREVHFTARNWEFLKSKKL